MNNIEQISINNLLHNVVRFDETDFQQIRHFVLELCKKLDDPTYFITDDIDSDLPILLKEKYGLVYGIIHENNIVALQAIDYNINKTLIFYDILGIDKNNNTIIEIGWAMVSPQCRKKGFSIHLSKLLEQATYLEIGNKICVTTIHPKNTNSLFLFLRLGYIGIKLTCHYNVIRLVMIKKLNSYFSIVSTQESIIVKNDDFEQQAQLLENGHVCNAAFEEQSNVFLKFIKFNSKIWL